ncbi:carboxymuconolactone decarboxylase family protein [Streptomyces sp. NPDC051684]|uniref:carboxymuconolactone decarboxylase family protein n=1 Tax=Streptomyces sp. NPDC051684 TaxID=3365670 RepID=UPI0037BA34E2
MPRIEPLTSPYPASIDQALRRWMPPGVTHEPLALFRVLHRNPELASRMFALGSGLLGHGLLPAIDREIVIARTTARTGCAYEWGVHAAALSRQAGLTGEHLRATTDIDTAAGTVWSPRHAALIDAVDELHDTAHLSQPAWESLSAYYEDAQLLEFLVLAGWYRTISYLANGLLLEEEPWGTPLPGTDRSDSRLEP